IWLNTPTRPLEASGTSGEKAEMNGVLNFSVLDGWWYEGYKFDEKAGWALTDKRTFTDQSQQDKLDAATIYSMLENEIIPLYFAKNSKGYSPEWVQYVKRSIGHIAPHFTMKRMIDDYIDRFYNKEAKRTAQLRANDFAMAREIVAWKQNVAQLWDGVKVLSVNDNKLPGMTNFTGDAHDTTVVVDTNGLGRNLGVECVAYKSENGEDRLWKTEDLNVVNEDGNVLTYELKNTLRDPGVFRYAYRIYPKNSALPHRQDFAWVRWI
ncbi:MAG: DUF3417 domain-containing protein, partial [Muribaculaceae bacterium]|nr:DUF3417 domain-containing protein [Muribaculaceae bacterium]